MDFYAVKRIDTQLQNNGRKATMSTPGNKDAANFQCLLVSGDFGGNAHRGTR